MSAAHFTTPSEVFEGIGGFKNMYPVIYKIYKSNLKDHGQKILSIVVRIFQAHVDSNPGHLKQLM